MSVDSLCTEILKTRERALSRRTSGYPRQNPIASDISVCTRELVLQMTNWQDRPLPETDLKARFERGNVLQEEITRELMALGFAVGIDRLPFEIKDAKGHVILRGKVDGFVTYEGKQYPMEIKTVDPLIFRCVNTVHDFQRWHWMAKYPAQLMGYLYGNNMEEGFFLLDDCKGTWKLLPLILDYAEMEKILRRCEQAVDHRDSGTLPDYYTDAEVCRKCWAFGRVCFPPIAAEGTILLDDPEFEAKLERREELFPAHKEYEDLDEDVKKSVRGKNGVLVGRFLITGKEIMRHYKAQEERDMMTWQSKILVMEEIKK